MRIHGADMGNGQELVTRSSSDHFLDFLNIRLTPQRKQYSNNNDIIASRLPTPAPTTTGMLLRSAPDCGHVSN